MPAPPYARSSPQILLTGQVTILTRYVSKGDETIVSPLPPSLRYGRQVGAPGHYRCCRAIIVTPLPPSLRYGRQVGAGAPCFCHFRSGMLFPLLLKERGKGVRYKEAGQRNHNTSFLLRRRSPFAPVRSFLASQRDKLAARCGMTTRWRI